MKTSRKASIVLAFIVVLFLMTSIALAEDATNDDWLTSSGDTYVTNSNVGIGTTSPIGSFDVRTSSDSTPGAFVVRYVDNIAETNYFKWAGIGTNYHAWTIGVPNSGDFIINYDYTSEGIADFESENNYFTIERDTGKVGIGTTSPDKKLHIVGNLKIENADPNNFIYLHNSDSGHGLAIRFYNSDIGNRTMFVPYPDGSSSWGSEFGYDFDNDIWFFDTNVGIGTLSPQSKLAVNGTITAKEVNVTETGWSDFVFEDHYPLPSLDHVETFIKQNKHLPDIPSAKEVKENGLPLAEIVTKQMQKIEELTLYVIEQNKRLNQVIKENQELRGELSELKNMN